MRVSFLFEELHQTRGISEVIIKAEASGVSVGKRERRDREYTGRRDDPEGCHGAEGEGAEVLLNNSAGGWGRTRSVRPRENAPVVVRVELILAKRNCRKDPGMCSDETGMDKFIAAFIFFPPPYLLYFYKGTCFFFRFSKIRELNSLSHSTCVCVRVYSRSCVYKRRPRKFIPAGSFVPRRGTKTFNRNFLRYEIRDGMNEGTQCTCEKYLCNAREASGTHGGK